MTLLTQFFATNGEDLGTHMLPFDPFPGDYVRVGEVRLQVIRRTCVSIPGDAPPWEDPNRIDLELTVREA